MMVPTIAAFIVPLAFDTLAVAVLLGLRGMRPLRPALTFALFEAAAPLVGLLVGRAFGASFQTPAVVLGGVVLLVVAVYTLKEALEDEDETGRLAFTSLRTAAMAGLGVSMDELAVGFPMGTSGLPLLPTLAAIAVQAFAVTYAGMLAGARLGATRGRLTSRLAGFAAAAGFAVLGAYLIAQRFAPGLPSV